MDGQMLEHSETWATSRAHLSEEQAAAFDAAIAFLRSDKPFFVLHGLAGTGKTTVLAALARVLPHAILCTLTGKAASVLQRKTGQHACTIHSAFYELLEIRKDKKNRREMVWAQSVLDNAMQDGIILLDECSMVSGDIARDMLSTGAKIIACGDPGQLPPVKGQQFFCVPDFILKTIHRQAWDSPILRQAHAVREGERYRADGSAFRISKLAEDNDIIDAGALLCFSNALRHTLNTEARKVRGLESGGPQALEPIMCLRNNKKHRLYNGAVYTLAAPYDAASNLIWLDVDGETIGVFGGTFESITPSKELFEEGATPFAFGYAMTVHKAQGSEFSSVVLFDEYRGRPDSSRWLYTGITRAADSILIVN